MLFLKIKIFNLTQECINICRYYKNLQFAFLDSFLKIIYLFQNPYRISKKFLLKKKEEDVHQYGETPLLTFEKMIRISEVSSQDIFYEFGAGRGRLCFWMHAFKHCKTVGVEQIPFFCIVADFLTNIFRLKNLRFIKGNMTHIDVSDATFIYLCGTCLSDDEVYNILKTLKKVASKTKILSVSYPLTEYDAASYRILKEIPVQFAWGSTVAYLQEKV
ncbi:MAG: hypothetical protein PVI40_04755 [Chlamydiota bacterium]|jgi:hypothetical protein